MYTRGQFAVMCNVGKKALRLYHEEGLLIPVYINKDNGYHYYDETQAEILERIKQYRKLGLSLFEIKQILDGRESETNIIESKIKETDQRLKEMKAYKTAADTDDAKTKDEKIGFRPFPHCKCIYVYENVDREELGMSVGKLYERVSREQLKIAGAHFVIFDAMDDEERFSMKTCIPVYGYNGDDAVEVSEENCMHINFKGGFSKIGRAHQMLRDHAESSGIKLQERVYEVYNKDMSVDIYYVI